jgi:hypothetical protein
MDVTIRKDSELDLEKALNHPVEPPCSPNSQSTWESQNETLNSPIVEQIVVEEDSDEESGRLRSLQLLFMTENLVVRPQAPISRAGRLSRAIFPAWFRKSSIQPFQTIVRKSETVPSRIEAFCH